MRILLVCLILATTLSCAKKVQMDLMEKICEVETNRHNTDSLEDGFHQFGNRYMDAYLADPGSAEALWRELETANDFCRGPLLSLAVDAHFDYLLSTWPQTDRLLSEAHRTLLLNMLGSSKPAGYEEIVFHYLEYGEDPVTRKVAAVKLTGLDQGAYINRILERFKHEEDGTVLAEILAGLDAVKYPQLYQVMKEVYPHPDALIHETVMTAWATSDLPDKCELIARYLEHPNPKVVYQAKGLLESLKGREKLAFTPTLATPNLLKKDAAEEEAEQVEAAEPELDRELQQQLRDAVIFGRMDEVDALVAKGANLAYTAYARPMLHSVVASISDDTLKGLMARGLDLKVMEGGNNLIHAMAADNFLRPLRLTEDKVRWVEAPQDAVTSRLAFLIEHGLDPNAKNGVGQTPLIRAAMGNKLFAVKALLENGVDLAVRDENGRDALMWSRMMENDLVTAVLEEALGRSLSKQE